MIGELVMIRGGDVGIVTRISDGWLEINNDINNVALPGDVVVIDPETDRRTLVWLARDMGVDPLKAHRIPEQVEKYARKLEKKSMEAQVHQPLKELEEVRQQLKESRDKFESEKKELDHKLSELLLAQAKHDKCIAAKDAEIAALKEQLREALLDVGKKEFAELAYEKQQHALTVDKLKAAQAQLEAIKAEANRPKKLVWEVKFCKHILPASFAALLNDGWDVMWQDGTFDSDGDYIINANFKRLVELPADPAPDPNAAIAAAEAHIATLEDAPAEDPVEIETPELDVVYHISGAKQPVTLGPIGQHIRKHGAADALDVMNAQIGANVSAAMAQALEDPVIQRMLNPQPLLSSAQSQSVQ